jgi:putative transposase
VSRVKQGLRVQLQPTAEQRQRLGRHAGLSRVVENFCLELVKATIEQRNAGKTYGVPEAEVDAGALVCSHLGKGVAGG